MLRTDADEIRQQVRRNIDLAKACAPKVTSDENERQMRVALDDIPIATNWSPQQLNQFVQSTRECSGIVARMQRQMDLDIESLA